MSFLFLLLLELSSTLEFVAGMMGILAGVGILSLLKNPELKEVLAIIPRKVFREKDVVLDEIAKID